MQFPTDRLDTTNLNDALPVLSEMLSEKANYLTRNGEEFSITDEATDATDLGLLSVSMIKTAFVPPTELTTA